MSVFWQIISIVHKMLLVKIKLLNDMNILYHQITDQKQKQTKQTKNSTASEGYWQKLMQKCNHASNTITVIFIYPFSDKASNAEFFQIFLRDLYHT